MSKNRKSGRRVSGNPAKRAEQEFSAEARLNGHPAGGSAGFPSVGDGGRHGSRGDTCSRGKTSEQIFAEMLNPYDRRCDSCGGPVMWLNPDLDEAGLVELENEPSLSERDDEFKGMIRELFESGDLKNWDIWHCADLGCSGKGMRAFEFGGVEGLDELLERENGRGF